MKGNTFLPDSLFAKRQGPKGKTQKKTGLELAVFRFRAAPEKSSGRERKENLEQWGQGDKHWTGKVKTTWLVKQT